MTNFFPIVTIVGKLKETTLAFAIENTISRLVCNKDALIHQIDGQIELFYHKNYKNNTEILHKCYNGNYNIILRLYNIQFMEKPNMHL